MKRLIIVALVLAACSGSGARPTELVLMTHDSFAVSPDVLQEFESTEGITVKILQAGDAGTMVNQAILTKDHPVADVLFGVDNTLLQRAIDAGIFESYDSPSLAKVPEELRAGTRGLATPVDFGDVCINYDKAGLAAAGVPPPTRLEDLADPRYRGMLVVEDPSTSSPGLAFLIATVAAFGEDGYRDYWRALRTNDVLVESGWEAAYYGSFSGGSGQGDRPLVVSYASSPPAEVIFATEPLDEAPTAVMTEGCFRQVEYAAVLQGNGAPELARNFIDFLLSRSFQEDVPLSMFVFPASGEAVLPDAFVRFTQIPDHPFTMDPEEIGRGRDRWIAAWSDDVLR